MFGELKKKRKVGVGDNKIKMKAEISKKINENDLSEKKNISDSIL